MSLQDRVNAALVARLDADYRRALADGLLAAVIGEAERLRSSGVSVRELSSDQRIGAIRLDGADLPAAPAIDKPDELASWLAEHFPDLVTATIRVPVEKLAEALEALGYAGLVTPAVSATVAPRDLAEVLAWLARECVVQADPQIPRAWNVLHRDEEGHLTPVPGTTARPPVPSWKVLVDKDKKRDALAVAAADAETMVADLERDTATPTPQDLAAAARSDLRDELAETEGEEAEVRASLAHDEAHAADTADDVETLAERLERGMRAGDPEAAAAHAILVQGGYSTPEIEAERMEADRRRADVRERQIAAVMEDQHTTVGFPAGHDPVTPNMPRPILVTRARELGLPVSGTKTELVARINSPRRPDVSPAELGQDLKDAAEEDGYDGPLPGDHAHPSEAGDLY